MTGKELEKAIEQVYNIKQPSKHRISDLIKEIELKAQREIGRTYRKIADKSPADAVDYIGQLEGEIDYLLIKLNEGNNLI